MSRSPLSTDATGAADPGYLGGWVAVNRLMRRGFSWSGRERNNAYLNLRDGRFADCSAVAGLDFADDARAAAVIDWDHDGDSDLFVTNRNGPRVRFLRNDAAVEGRFVSLRLVGAGSNTAAIGARVELEVEGGGPIRRVRTVRAGEGFLAQSSAWLSFGLGDARPLRARVRWPGGGTEVFDGVAAGDWFLLEEGRGRPRRWKPPKVALPDAPAPEPPAASSTTHLPLASPTPMPALALETPDGRPALLFGRAADGSRRTTGEPLAVLLWASWCAPCTVELRELADRAAELSAAGLRVLALSADAPEDRRAANDFLDSIAWPFSRGFATPEAVEVLEVLAGALTDSEARLSVPAGFLVDGEGDLVTLTLGRIELERLLEDVAGLDRSPVERRDAAVPFPGTWLREPPERDLDALAARYERRGLEEVAGEYRALGYRVVQRSRAELLHEFGRTRAARGDLEGAAQLFRRAIEEDPRSLEAHADLALVLHRLGHPADAVALYERALTLDPEREEVHVGLALALVALDRREEARRELAILRRMGSARADEIQRLIQGGN